MFCPNCGYKNDEGSRFCESCGSSMEQPKPASNSAQSGQYDYQSNANPKAYASVQGTGSGNILSLGQYIGMMFLAAIPIVGFIFMLIWSFGSDVNPNKKNWARATLIIGGISTVLIMIIYGVILQSIMRF